MKYPNWKNTCAIYTLISDSLIKNNINIKNKNGKDIVLEITNDLYDFFTNEKENKSDKYYCGTCDITFSKNNFIRHKKHNFLLNKINK